MDFCEFLNNFISFHFLENMLKTLENIYFIMNSSCVQEIKNLHPHKTIEYYSEMSRWSVKLL